MQHFKVVPFASDTLLPTFIKLLEAFLENTFYTSVSALITVAATSLMLANHCPFKHFLVAETAKS
jgi:hypothetical protein